MPRGFSCHANSPSRRPDGESGFRGLFYRSRSPLTTGWRVLVPGTHGEGSGGELLPGAGGGVHQRLHGGTPPPDVRLLKSGRRQLGEGPSLHPPTEKWREHPGSDAPTRSWASTSPRQDLHPWDPTTPSSLCTQRAPLEEVFRGDLGTRRWHPMGREDPSKQAHNC